MDFKNKNNKNKYKESLDDWLNENVNLPLAKRGHENIGAGLSALGSAAGELIIPDDASDLAMAAVPGGKIAKSLKKIFSKSKKAPIKKASDTKEKYSNLEVPKASEKPRIKPEQKKQFKGAKMRGEKVNEEVNAAYAKAKEADEKRKKHLREGGITLDYSKNK